MAMPEFAREIGIVGAFLLGKKGAVGLASISFVIDKVSDLLKKERIGSGLIDVANIEEAKIRLAEINKQLEDGLKKELEFIDVRNKGTIIVENYNALSEEQLNTLRKQKLELEDFIKFEKIKSGVLSESNHHLFEMANNVEKIKEEQKEIVKFTSISNQHMFEMANAVKKTEETFKSMNETALKNLQEKFTNISTSIKEGLNSGITSFSNALSRAIILGEDLGKSFKRMVQDALVQTLAILIEVIIRLGIQKLLNIELEKQENKKLNNAKKYTSELKKQVGLAFLLAILTGGGSMGFGSSGPTSGKRASGGSVQKDQAYLVGENGPELFIPNQTGQITQSARGTGNGGATTVNFNINTVDASGFEELLFRSRGTITQLINSAVNERGREALI
jgi:hypothetical protein